MPQETIYKLTWTLAVVCFFVLVLIIWNSMLKKSVKNKTVELTASLDALKKSEAQYRDLLANLNVGIVVYGADEKMLLSNQTYRGFMGIENLNNADADIQVDFVNEDGTQAHALNYIVQAVLTDNVSVRDYIVGIVRAKNDTLWVQINVFPDYNARGQLEQIVVTLTDITEIKKAEQQVRGLVQLQTAILNNAAYMIISTDTNGVITTFNVAAERDLGYSAEECIGRLNVLVIHNTMEVAERAKIFSEELGMAIEPGFEVFAAKARLNLANEYEWTYIRKDGSSFPVLLTITALRDSEENIRGYLGIANDITERKAVEERLYFLSMHDSLTGLHNRTYFEQEFGRISDSCAPPISLVICDVDGLKLVNDTLGHTAGDQILIAAAHIIGRATREGDIVARIGGDEFAIVLPQANEQVAESVCARIREQINSYNVVNTGVTLSLSLGYAVKNHGMTSMGDLFREADAYMYREKLHRSQSARSDIVQVAMKLLEVRDFVTEGHAERLQDLASELARSIGLPEKRITDIRLLAQFHDIGKVGIPDNILFKPGLLTTEEKKEMQRHSEIGYRIAFSSVELAHIADWILKHHEWWNGQGYPLGLEKDDIPVECRILAIVDSYDAMTSDRPYRKAMSHEAAIAELKQYSGTQFDPELVKKFILTMER